ncbi:MAG: nucleoside 2-deoxyribosyltransferase domain-containing protein, partial [Pseudomonadota bacterium]|nr:nucleoside 2-deoxyribosyltransferase domain-containing protein [Pseudomonadota bacterium]
MITEIYAYESAPSSYQAALFLAGPTPRDSDVASWRLEALALLHKLEPTIDLVVFIPEPHDGHAHSDYLQQVTWEQQHLEMADAILIWLPRDMNTSLKGLTTNIEFGKYIDSGKLFYGRPEHADHVRYLDWLYRDTTARTPQTQLNTLITEILTYLTTQLESSPVKTRVDGERFVPLMIWQSKLFQAWYQRQQHVGNQLLKAKLLWVFILNKLNFTFAYALHVDVWITAENRVKNNEFIISRPDISVVIPYWKHPTDIMKSEVMLIQEFRAPGRTADGFVYELPGGSTF